MVCDRNRVGRHMIVVVEIVISQLMWEALTRQGCQLFTMLETNKSLPSGVTGSHLKTELTGQNEYLRQTAAYR